MSSPTRLVVGLGNPGPRYEATRHNVGFAVIDRLIARAREAGEFESEPCDGAELGRWRTARGDLLLLKPMTYMNRSGGPTAAVLSAREIVPADWLAVFDDLDLPLGRLRVRRGGSAGGHNGVKSLLAEAPPDEDAAKFGRLRLGIGRPEPGTAIEDYVLEPFVGEEVTSAAAMVERATEAVLHWWEHGLDAAMNLFNRVEPPPRGGDRRPDRASGTDAGGETRSNRGGRSPSDEGASRGSLSSPRGPNLPRKDAHRSGETPAEGAKLTERLYEGMFLLDSNEAAKGWSDLESHVTGMVEKHSGKLQHSERWPDQRLATEIKGVKKGTYFLTYFTAPTDQIAGLRRDVELSDRILRFLVIQEDFLEEEMQRRKDQAKRRAEQPAPAPTPPPAAKEAPAEEAPAAEAAPAEEAPAAAEETTEASAEAEEPKAEE